MGYPNPQESPYDLFMTGHAGCERLAPCSGLQGGDDLLGQHEPHSGRGDRRRGLSRRASSSRR